MTIWVAYRLAPPSKPSVRPSWFDQAACLRSFAAAVDVARAHGLELEMHSFIDGTVDPSVIEIVETLGRVHRTVSHGNSPTAREVFTAALASGFPHLLFAEDDYLWTSTAVFDLLRVVLTQPEVDYASPYRVVVPDSTSRPPRRSYVVDGNRWRSVELKPMTMATRRTALQRDLGVWELATYGRSPKDVYAFPAILRGRWLRLVGNAGARDLSRITNVKTARVILRSIRTRLRPRHRPVLVEPDQPLATHVHEPYLAHGVDWEQLSESFRTSSPD